MEVVGVGEMRGATKGKPFQEEKCGKNSQKTVANDGQMYSADCFPSEDEKIREGVANGRVVVKRPGQQH